MVREELFRRRERGKGESWIRKDRKGRKGRRTHVLELGQKKRDCISCRICSEIDEHD
jgi:hypothetical protein